MILKTLLLLPTVISIIDTGSNLEHLSLRPHAFENKAEIRDGLDNDRNNYVDDHQGWNFINMIPEVFEAHLYPHFEEDFYTYYEVRKKRSLKIQTEEEENWYQEKRKDDAFQEKRDLFRRYIHATHVAGLASGLGLKEIIGEAHFERLNYRPRLMGITYLGDATSGPAVEPTYTPLIKGSFEARLSHLHTFLKSYLKWQESKLRLAIDYSAQFSQVVNCSFGISPKGARSMAESWWEDEFGKTLIEDQTELERLTKNLRDGLLALTENIVEDYKDVLFVFSAGNTGLMTEEETHYPSGTKCDHCLSVGATLGTMEMASFSNHAPTRVSLFAPGVGMKSTVSYDRSLPVNGTSQAAPQVAYAAARVFDVAKERGIPIRASLVKRILMATVDKKEFLKEKCASEGIVNPLRASLATKLLKNKDFESAIKESLQRIGDQSFFPGPLGPVQSISKGEFGAIEADPLLF